MKWIKTSERLPDKKGYYIVNSDYINEAGSTQIIPNDRSDTYFDGEKFEGKNWKAIEWLDESDEWIDVKDMFPEEGDRVLCLNQNGGIEVGYILKGEWERNWAGLAFIEAGYIITHWQPLPPKPSKL